MSSAVGWLPLVFTTLGGGVVGSPELGQVSAQLGRPVEANGFVMLAPLRRD